MKQEIKQRKAQFLALAKAAGFENLTQFAKGTISPVSGKPRSFAAVKYHIEKKPPYDYRVLQSYADDLKAPLHVVMELFGVVPAYNFEEHLQEMGFASAWSDGDDCVDFTINLPGISSEVNEYTILIKAEKPFALSENLPPVSRIICMLTKKLGGGFIANDILFELPFKPASKAMTEMLLAEYLSHTEKALKTC